MTRASHDVLFVLALNQLGGAEKSLMTVAAGLQKMGLRVAVAIYGSRQDLFPAGTGCTLYTLPVTSSAGALWPLSKLMKQTGVPVVISALRHPNVITLLAACLAGPQIRTIVTEHSTLSGGFAHLRSWKHRLMRHLITFFYRRADAVVAVSEGMAEDLRKVLGKNAKVNLIHNPIVPDVPFKRSAPPHPWLKDKAVPLVMALGRLSVEKDMATLLRAFAEISQQHPARLIIIGDGPERASLEALAKELRVAEQVHFSGYVERAHDWLQHAQLFVSASRFEGFGNAIVEAMAAKVPVLATDCPVGPREILAGGKYGRLIPVGDANSMSNAMLQMLAHPPATEDAYHRSQHFKHSASFAAYAELIRKLSASPRPPSLLYRLQKKLRAVLLHEHWMVGIVNSPVATAPGWKKCPEVHWLKPLSSGYYLADPFPVPGTTDRFFCERFDLTTKLGTLCEVRLENDRIAQETPVTLDLEGHLSYPYLFSHQNTLYCMPESGAARTLAIFSLRADGRWERCATPLTGVAAADSVFFTHEGRLWIAYTDEDIGPYDNLNLLYADTLDGPWIPHENNPVQRGKRHSRGGGKPFRIGDHLYRPAQDCSEFYGGGLTLMRVTECSPDTFIEKEVAHFLPDAAGENPHGLHTLSGWGERCLVDGMRLRFSPLTVLRKLRKRMKRKR